MAQGSTPRALESSAAAATAASATSSGALRPAAARALSLHCGANAAIARPHRPIAVAWLNRVGEGGTL